MTGKILLERTSSNTEAALFMKLLEHHLHTSKNLYIYEKIQCSLCYRVL